MNHWWHRICWPDQEKKRKIRCVFYSSQSVSTVVFGGGAEVITLKKTKKQKKQKERGCPAFSAQLFCPWQIPVWRCTDGGKLRSDVWLCATKQHSYLRNDIWEGKSVNASHLTMIHPPCLQMPGIQEAGWLSLNWKLLQSPNFPTSCVVPEWYDSFHSSLVRSGVGPRSACVFTVKRAEWMAVVLSMKELPHQINVY